MGEALHYEKKVWGIQCRLCPHLCCLKTGETGLCGVRKEKEGKLVTLNYGMLAAFGIDPIEKKPLYHFLPGKDILSLGTFGCNLDCGFCQNWQLARNENGLQRRYLEPGDIIDMLSKQEGATTMGVAYTYSEPGMWFEFVSEASRAVHQKGYKNVLVTNGYLNEEPLKELIPFIDAFNIDVKAFNDEYYRKHCRGSLAPVLRYVEEAAASAHVELTYLVVPTLNDDIKEVQEFVDWVASLSPSIPVHLTRYFPQHRFNLPPTPVKIMEKLRQVALEKLRYVYLGNISGNSADTNCPNCRNPLVLRKGYKVRVLLQDINCPYCREKTDFILK